VRAVWGMLNPAPGCSNGGVRFGHRLANPKLETAVFAAATCKWPALCGCLPVPTVYVKSNCRREKVMEVTAMSFNDALEQIENVRCAAACCAALSPCCAVVMLPAPLAAVLCCLLLCGSVLVFCWLEFVVESLGLGCCNPHLPSCRLRALVCFCRWATTSSCSRTRPTATSRCSTAAGEALCTCAHVPCFSVVVVIWSGGGLTQGAHRHR